MQDDLAARRAIEALRAGVPNRSAVRRLATGETEIEQAFLDSLKQAAVGLPPAGRPLVLAGGFGTGKSHLLGYLEERALDKDFIVSPVVVSKETPLFDPGKMLAAAMRNAVVPRTNDDVMTAVLARMKAGRTDDLEARVSNPAARFSPLFAAILHLLPRAAATPERVRGFGRFLAGGRLNMVELRAALGEVGARKLFDIKPVKEPELTFQRIRFAPMLFQSAGFSGWCILLDEVELIGRYSALQRGRAYAELARWLGLAEDVRVPGIVAAAAITDDFSDVVINARQDDEKLPERLRARGLDEAAKLSRLAMEHLKRHQRLLRPPSGRELQADLEKVRKLYAEAYQATGLPVLGVGEILANRSMRQHIKSWITQWDMYRLYGRNLETEQEDIKPDYSEDTTMEEPAEGGGGEDGGD